MGPLRDITSSGAPDIANHLHCKRLLFRKEAKLLISVRLGLGLYDLYSFWVVR